MADSVRARCRLAQHLTASACLPARGRDCRPKELHAIFQALGIKAPATGNELTEPFPFNLMFQTSIGPTGQIAGFLRPETAQGMFVNFRRLYDYNNGRMPMAVAQIGLAYRNEIAPRGGLLRCVLEGEGFAGRMEACAAALLRRAATRHEPDPAARTLATAPCALQRPRVYHGGD